MGSRLDGHIVQGHVDQTAICTNIEEDNGSWRYYFKYDTRFGNLTIEKGSITINGVSLIIPYTYENTGFKNLSKGDTINLEFDVIGKYVKRFTQHY